LSHQDRIAHAAEIEMNIQPHHFRATPEACMRPRSTVSISSSVSARMGKGRKIHQGNSGPPQRQAPLQMLQALTSKRRRVAGLQWPPPDLSLISAWVMFRDQRPAFAAAAIWLCISAAVVMRARRHSSRIDMTSKQSRPPR
jgi:hypothetical protein